MRTMDKTIVPTAWCLLAFWLFFSGLEFAEVLAVAGDLPAAEEAAELDLDQEALEQLASGIKPAVPFIDSPPGQPVAIAGTIPIVRFDEPARDERLLPPPLRLHQRLSVYRI